MQYFVLILTEGCLDQCGNQKDWLRREIARALALKKKVVPIEMPGFVTPDKETLPKDIQEVLRHQFIAYSVQYFDSFARRLRQFIPPKEGGENGGKRRAPRAILRAGGAALEAIAIALTPWLVTSRGCRPPDTITETDKNIFATGLSMGTQGAKITCRFPGQTVVLSPAESAAATGLLVGLGLRGADVLVMRLAELMRQAQFDTSVTATAAVFKSFATLTTPVRDFMSARYSKRGLAIYVLALGVTPLRYTMQKFDQIETFRDRGELTPDQESTIGRFSAKQPFEPYQSSIKATGTSGWLPRGVAASAVAIGSLDLLTTDGRSRAKQELVRIGTAFDMPMDTALRQVSGMGYTTESGVSAAPTAPTRGVTGDTIFKDDFEGGSLARWRVKNVRGRGWRVEDGRCVGGGVAVLTTPETTWSNYLLEAKARLTRFTSRGGDFRIIVRQRAIPDKTRGYHFMLNAGQLAIGQKVGGTDREFFAVPWPASRQGWVQLAARAHGDTVQFFIDGRLAGTIVDSTYPTGGIGLGVAEADAEFDDVVVRRLE